MCCLRYEQNVYEEKLSRLPKVGATVKAPEEGIGTVDSIETLKEKIKVRLKDGDDIFYRKYDINEIKIIKNIGKDIVSQSEEDEEDLKELEKMEKLDRMEQEGGED